MCGLIVFVGGEYRLRHEVSMNFGKEVVTECILYQSNDKLSTVQFTVCVCVWCYLVLCQLLYWK